MLILKNSAISFFDIKPTTILSINLCEKTKLTNNSILEIFFFVNIGLYKLIFDVVFCILFSINKNFFLVKIL